jgi:hypothetical protein
MEVTEDHVHTPEACPYGNLEKARDTFGKMMSRVERLGEKLVGAWVNASAHTVYLVVETDSFQKIEELLAPIISIVHAETKAVSEAAVVIKRQVGE